MPMPSMTISKMRRASWSRTLRARKGPIRATVMGHDDALVIRAPNPLINHSRKTRSASSHQAQHLTTISSMSGDPSAIAARTSPHQRDTSVQPERSEGQTAGATSRSVEVRSKGEWVRVPTDAQPGRSSRCSGTTIKRPRANSGVRLGPADSSR